MSAALRAFLRSCERNELDAFPSGHTATSLVFLFEAWPMFRRQRVPLAAAVAAIVFSTVYLSLHYVIDVISGVALALLVLALLPRLRHLCAAQFLRASAAGRRECNDVRFGAQGRAARPSRRARARDAQRQGAAGIVDKSRRAQQPLPRAV